MNYKFKDYTFDRDVTLAVDYNGSTKKDYWITISGIKVRYYFTLHEGQDGMGEFNIPAGFKTDGASVPRILKPLFPAWNKHFKAILVHDCLCEFGAVAVYDGESVVATRADIDKLFFDMLESENCKYLPLVKAALNVYRFFRRPVAKSNTPIKIVFTL